MNLLMKIPKIKQITIFFYFIIFLLCKTICLPPSLGTQYSRLVVTVASGCVSKWIIVHENVARRNISEKIGRHQSSSAIQFSHVEPIIIHLSIWKDQKLTNHEQRYKMTKELKKQVGFQTKLWARFKYWLS